MKISLADQLANVGVGSMKMPKLKGRAIITLTDVKTGQRERFVNDNMVTDAVAKIFEMNYLGMSNFNAMMAIKQLFGGCFMFTQTLTESVNTIFPPNSTSNNLVARAGQTAHASTPTDTRWGHPVTPEITDDHIKFAWDWNQDEGNGTINSVCLTHQLAGDYGINCDGSASLLSNYSNIVQNVNFFSTNTLRDDLFTRDRVKAMPYAFDSDGNGLSLWLTSTELEEITVAHSFVKANLLENAVMYPYTNYRELSSRTATLSRTFDTSYTYLAQDASNYYVMERDSGSNTKVYIDVVAKSDMSVTALTLTISGATLARNSVAYNGAAKYAGIVSGGNVYWPSGSDAKTFVRISLSDAADVEELTSTLTNNLDFGQSPFNFSDGLVLGANFLINGQRVYPVARRAALSGDYVRFDMLASANGGPAAFRSGYAADGATYYASTQSGMLVLPYLATVNNLQTSVQKSNSKTMRLEYVLTQV